MTPPNAEVGVINWTPPMLKRFKKDYSAAVDEGVTVFTFDGHEVVVGYAKYLIEYLDMTFHPQTR